MESARGQREAAASDFAQTHSLRDAQKFNGHAQFVIEEGERESPTHNKKGLLFQSVRQQETTPLLPLSLARVKDAAAGQAAKIAQKWCALALDDGLTGLSY